MISSLNDIMIDNLVVKSLAIHNSGLEAVVTIFNIKTLL